MSNKGIKQNFFYNSLLTSAGYLFPIITLPYISRVLGVQNIGLCNFIDSIINYFIIFSMMGMALMGVREIARCGSDRKKLDATFSSLLTLNLVTTVLSIVFLVVITCTIPKLWQHWDLMMVGGFKLLFNVLLIEWLFKGLEDFKYITMRTLVLKIFYTLSIFLFVKSKGDYVIYYGLTTLVVVLNAFVNVFYARRFVTFSLKSISFRPFLRTYFIMGAYYIITSMYTSLNVTYLGFVAGDTEVGYYTTATKLFTVSLSVFSAFTAVMLPRMSALIAENNMERYMDLLRRSIQLLLIVALPIIIIVAFNAKFVIRVAAGHGYEGAIVPMIIILPLFIIVGLEQIFIIQGLMPMKKDTAVFINSCIGAVVGIGLNLLLVPHYHSTGSAVVWAVSETAVLLSAVYYLRKFVSLKIDWDELSKIFMTNMPLVLLIAGISYFYSGLVVFCLEGCWIAIYLLVANRYWLKNEDLSRAVSVVFQKIRRFV